MRQSERPFPDIEFPGRYALDEARFSGGSDHIFNKEDPSHEPSTRISE